MNKTLIETVKNPDGTPGYTWNPFSGCLYHDDGLCKGGGFPCYAYRLANGRLRTRYLANQNYAPLDFGKDTEYPRVVHAKVMDDPFYPRCWPERLYIPYYGKPKGIFVCDMGELFGDWVPRQWQEDIFRIIRLHPNDRFYLLTKQPQNLVKWSPFPDNCWVGVTACNWKMAFDAFWELQDIKATVKYISFEPLLDNVAHRELEGWLRRTGIKWVIIGAQTKPYKPPKIEWVEEIIEACNHIGIPIFIKDNLKPFLDTQPTRIVYQYGSGKLRQEIPNEP